MTKYIAKRKPTYIFNVQDRNKYRQHIQDFRLEAIELMFLILNKCICDSSVQVQYLITDSPSTRQKAILLISLLMNSNNIPFLSDSIESILIN
jgi:hypothetical protein